MPSNTVCAKFITLKEATLGGVVALGGAIYQLKRKEGKPAKMALVAAMRDPGSRGKLLVILNALVRTNQPWCLKGESA